RELRMPLRVSVSRLVAPVCSPRFLPLPPYVARPPEPGGASSDDLVSIIRDAAAGSDRRPEDLYCLAEIRVANTGAADLCLDIDTDLSHGGAAAAHVVQTLQVHVPAGGEAVRLAVPLPRLALSRTALSVPIPGVEADGGLDDSLEYPWRAPLLPDDAAEKWESGVGRRRRARQFVVSHTGSQRELDEVRAVFWYQRAIVDRVRIRWTCEHSQRRGYVDPRALVALDARSLVVVRPGDVQASLLVDGAPVLRAGRHLLQARCAAQRPTEIVFTLANTTAVDLRAVFSVRVERDQPPATGVSQAADPHVAAASANMSFAANMPPSPGSARRFRFCPAVAGLGVPDGRQGGQLRTGTHAQPLPPADRLVLDDIDEMRLPQIKPHAVYRLALPMYALLPGRYQIEYCVRRLDDGSSSMRERLVVDAT
ncbi:hypothetical protein H4R19_001328, partial [Coemansia spiralis]